MTSERQNAANRRNAQRSTGPRTVNGKQQTRRNAVRHGLTAETVIGVLEDPAEYGAFEAAIVADYSPGSAAEHELIIRLASLFWRLRRAAAIESGLLQIQGEILRQRVVSHDVPHGRIALVVPGASSAQQTIAKNADIARCFLRLANLDNGLFERIGRYEARLCRQIARTLVLLDLVHRRCGR
jgi:hypothetical protein